MGRIYFDMTNGQRHALTVDKNADDGIVTEATYHRILITMHNSGPTGSIRIKDAYKTIALVVGQIVAVEYKD